MNKKIIKQIAGWLIAAVILYFLARTIHSNWAELENWEWRVDPLYAVLTVIFLGGAYLAACQGWRTILRGFGHNIKLHESFRVVYLANLGRYIPGKIWQVIGMVGLAKEVKVPAKTSLASFALVQAYALPASFLLVLIFLGGFDMPDSLAVYSNIIYIFMAAVFLLFLVLFLWPDGLDWALNKILKIFKQEPVGYKPTTGNRVAIFLWYIVTWILFGLSFHFFLKALIAEMPMDVIFGAGVYIAAYNLGYIALISPGGLGVREGVMTLLLAAPLGQPVAASIALIHRVLITIAEAIISLLALLTYKLK